MAERYVYLSLTPEALIASMLAPHDFGNYLAVGTKKRTRGQAIFFEVDIDKAPDELVPRDYIAERCVTKGDGSPKNSVYLSIYRVMERMPLAALKSLYLTTDDGRVLELKQGPWHPDNKQELHLYQELTPVKPRIASSLAPEKFMRYMTDPKEYVSLPKLVFAELQLRALATDPKHAALQDLPYPNIDHLRDCLVSLKEDPSKNKKTIIRFFDKDLMYRTIKNGFFVGQGTEMLYYPFPSVDELEEKHYAWWRSARSLGHN